MSWVLYLIAALGGLAAGAINTLAGYGSAITLAIMTELLGLPGNVANGTNRVGIMAASLTSLSVYQKKGALKKSWQAKVVIPILAGAVLGVLLAVWVDNESFLIIYKALMVIMLLLVILKPKRWLDPVAMNYPGHQIFNPVLLFLLGIYGGFIQMGMGIFFLALTVVLLGNKIKEANILKILVVGIYTVIVLVIFAYKGLVNWEIGLTMAIGQALGGWLSAKFLTDVKNAGLWAYRLLVVVIIAALVRMFFFS